MGIAYTAMLAAFFVDNGPHLPLWDRLPTQAFWLLPLVVAHLSSPALGTKRPSWPGAAHASGTAAAEHATCLQVRRRPGPDHLEHELHCRRDRQPES
jgi:hypothetical protein